MDDQYRHPYLDADVYIAWIKGESRHGRPCKPIVDHILRHAEAGTFRIGISTLMLAEVHKTRAGPTLSRAEDDTLLAFFEHDYFDFVDVDRNIGEDANRLCRQYGLRPNDTIHLASARSPDAAGARGVAVAYSAEGSRTPASTRRRQLAITRLIGRMGTT